MEKVTKCPHCKGDLKEVDTSYLAWQYECLRCRRAWIVLDDVYWLAGFDAGGHIYKIQKGQIEEVRASNPLWKQLWDRVR